MAWRDGEQQSMRACCTAKSARLLRSPLPAVDAPTPCPAPEPAANQDAPINKDSKSSNPRSLKQHTLAESISFCCFCFCLILRHRPFHHTNLQISSRSRFSTRFSFSWSYIFFVFVFASSVFVFIFSRLSHLLWIFLLLSWSGWYLGHSQRIPSQCRPIGGVVYSLRDETWRRRRDSVTSMLEISVEILSYQRKSLWGLAWSGLGTQSTSGIRPSCTYLLSRSNILVLLPVTLLARHDSWHEKFSFEFFITFCANILDVEINVTFHIEFYRRFSFSVFVFDLLFLNVN